MPAYNDDVWKAWDDAAHSGHVVYLYKFTLSGKNSQDTCFRYCTGTQPTTYEGEVYRPRVCRHGDIQITMQDATASIEMVATTAWIVLLIDNTPNKLHLNIVRYRPDISMGKQLYSGDYRGCELHTNIFKLSFGSSFTASDVDMITYYTQRYCNHAPYQRYCGLSFDAYKHVVPAGEWEVVGRKSVNIISPGLSLDPSYWAECVITYPVTVTEEGEDVTFELDNMAVNSGGKYIQTRYPISVYADPKKAALTIAPNCMLQLRRCRDVFGNLPRACAWPDMPLKNYTALNSVTAGTGTGGPVNTPGKHPGRP